MIRRIILTWEASPYKAACKAAMAAVSEVAWATAFLQCLTKADLPDDSHEPQNDFKAEASPIFTRSINTRVYERRNYTPVTHVNETLSKSIFISLHQCQDNVFIQTKGT